MARLVRVIRGVQDVRIEGETVRFILFSPKSNVKPWIKVNRGNVLAIKVHKVHDLGMVANPRGARSYYG